MPNIENQSNYTLTKLIRTGISPICAMIGTSAYYGQVIANPVLGSINSLLFGKKLGLDIWKKCLVIELIIFQFILKWLFLNVIR
ncbi:hypothetical protein [Spiroplasma endosymbiont of Phycita roborella]|uniref:hypothetical protein n=1 Tax=Spiroplasma endosymbiont of Phycita roborella TaxID=3066311 RepID=UPI00313B4790